VGITWYRSERLERDVAVAKVWNVESPPLDPFEVKFKTRCLKHRLLYQLTLRLKAADTDASPGAKPKQGFIPKTSPAVQRLWKDIRIFNVSFEDDEGFRLIHFEIAPDRWVNAVDDKNRHIGLTVDGEEICDIATYARIRRVSVGYRQQ